MAFTEDLAPYFADFAATSCAIGGVAVDAIFANRPAETLYASGTAPALTAKSADVSTVARGDPAVVNGLAYTVAKIEHDGTGLARLTLERA